MTDLDIPAGENDDIHAVFVYYLAQRGDKFLTAQCIHCAIQIPAKNVIRQKQHIKLECPRLNSFILSFGWSRGLQ